jgi:heme/copper-type cytochrome/quinol oxidase subunit 2
MLATIEEYRWVMMIVTFGFLGTAFYFTYRPRKGQVAQEDCCTPTISGGRRRFNMMTMNKIMLWGVTAMAVVFLFFPQIVTAMLTPDAGEFTTEMNRTTLSIEGMTCPG